MRRFVDWRRSMPRPDDVNYTAPMLFSPSARLGPYEILSFLGAGGMGEVYRARDTKLGRDVAIKVVPDAFAQDADRMARFNREAQLLAALNHPNIAAIYGVEDRALVMELVEGSTLAEGIARGAIPLEQATPVIEQIVDALEYAHEKGMVHRDLKPANIKITPEGRVKVLDFGLAKALASDSAPADPVSSPTLTMRATMAGVIMGTAAYMAPEQARGQSVDKRADIWAFGVVVYEMLTGRQLFAGPTVSDTLAAVLKEQPDLDLVPAPMRRLVRLCLVKDPRRRMRDIGDARIVLAEADEASVVTVPAPQPGRNWLPWTSAGVLAAAFVYIATIAWQATRPVSRPLMRLDVELGPDAVLTRSTSGGMLAISPDGTRLALTLRGADGKVRLYTRRLQQSQVTPLADTENASSPFFSPDGEWIGFFADAKLKKVSFEGGAAVTLCDAPIGRGGSWGDDGNIVVALNIIGGLARIPSAGGSPAPATKLESSERTHRWPQVLPGSQAVLFTASSSNGNYDDANIDVVSLKTGERKTVHRGGFYPRYLPSGHLVYVHQNTLFAARFDLARLTLAGAPVPVLEDVSAAGGAGGDFAFAQTGSFVYLAGQGRQAGWQILWLDVSGMRQPLQATLGRYFSPRLSPDGKRLAFCYAGARGLDIWVKDIDRDSPSRLSFFPGSNGSPVWTPDGKYIVFRSETPAAPGPYIVRSDGSGEPQRLMDSKVNELPTPYSFSPDGKRLAFYASGNSGSPDIFTAPVEGDPGHPRLGKPDLFVGTPFVEFQPAFSPDGRWIAYTSNESGTYEVYVRAFPGATSGSGKWLISTGGGLSPVWSRNGRELLFEALDDRVMSVSYTANRDSFVASKPRLWAETSLQNVGGFTNYDLAPDGKRIAALVSETVTGQPPITHLTFLVNFFDELQRRVPAGGK
jgi:Tol biopolymer transport system component/predicted Ser/Thr protein kinase